MTNDRINANNQCKQFLSKNLQANILYIKKLDNWMTNTLIRMYNGHIIVVVLKRKCDSK